MSPYFHFFQNVDLLYLAFPEMEAYCKIPANDSNVSRNPCAHSCAGELKATVDSSICVASVRHLDSFFCSSKVGSGARYHSIRLHQKLRNSKVFFKIQDI